MLPPPIIPAKARRHRKRRPPATTPAPPVVNQITSVAYGPAPEALVVTVTGTLISVGELEGLLSVDILGNAYTPIDVNLGSLPEVMLTFDRDVTEATAWTVPDPATWWFAAGPLVAPFGGNIE